MSGHGGRVAAVLRNALPPRLIRPPSRRVRRAAGLVAGFALDARFGDPRRGHPVAGFGRAAAACERRAYADSRARGAATWTALVVPTVLAGAAVERRAPLLGTAAATYVALGGHSLIREGLAMKDHLDDGDLPAARERLTHLCSRNPEHLDTGELARATVESLAENTSDAVVAPLLWGAVAGVPGIVGYRAVNTLDAMVGYRSPRYLRYGWFAAKADDVANYVPARITAALTCALAPLVGGDPLDGLLAWDKDAPKHPSPNAGPVEATAAAVLRVRLGGQSTYDGQVEDRGTLGTGRPPRPRDIRRAARLSWLLGLNGTAVAAATALAGAGLGLRGARRG